MTARPEPFLRWPGGKRGLMPALLARLPRGGWRGRYVEPFLGGGALFWELAAQGRLDGRRPLLADANRELVTTYEVVRDDPSGVANAFRRFAPEGVVVAEADYYAARDLDPDALEPGEVAGRMIFLNRLCYNGLYRVNKREGKMNTPWGKKRLPPDVGEANLYACSDALRRTRAELVCCAFDAPVASARGGDFVYADPPYDAPPGKKGFVAYTPEGFGDKDQERLAAALRAAAGRGAKVMASNALTEKVTGWYAGYPFRVEPLPAPRSIAADADARGDVLEVVVTAGYRPAPLRPRAAEPANEVLEF
jgi:DNA adenine methylase